MYSSAKPTQQGLPLAAGRLQGSSRVLLSERGGGLTLEGFSGCLEGESSGGKENLEFVSER